MRPETVAPRAPFTNSGILDTRRSDRPTLRPEVDVSGRIITLFRKRQFDYTFMAGAPAQIVTIHRSLRVPPFYYYWLGVRVHNKDITSGVFNIDVYQTLPSSEDPQEFTVGYNPPTFAPAMTVAVNSGTAVPSLVTPVTALNLGPYLRVVLRATTSAAGRFYAELSAVLHVRPT